MNPGIPLKDSTSWMVHQGHVSFPASLARIASSQIFLGPLRSPGGGGPCQRGRGRKSDAEGGGEPHGAAGGSADAASLL